MTRTLAWMLSGLLAAGCSSGRLAEGGGAGGRERAVAGERCSMSFADLFLAAKGRAWTEEEVRGFQALDQAGKNRMVKALAAEAGGIRTEDQVGTDGVVYTAFWREGKK